MKNTLWFLFPPADEREKEFYDKAYRKSFISLAILILILIILIFSFSGNSKIFNVDLFSVYLVISLVIAYFAGWTALNKEELSLGTGEEATKKPAMKTPLLFVFIIILFYFAGIIYWPESYLLINGLIIILLHLFFMAWAFISTRSMNLYLRIVLVILFPFLVVLAFWRKPVNAKHVIFGALAGLIIFFLFTAALILSTRAFVISPMYIATDYFKPDLTRNEYVLVDKRVKDFKTGDFIIFSKDNIGKIIEKSGDAWLIEISGGGAKVNKKDMVGLIKKNFVFSDYFSSKTE